jgi:DNA-binding NtrC family response regulator
VNVIVIDDEQSVLESFKMILGIRDHAVVTAQNLAEAVTAVAKQHFDVAFIDMRFEGKDEGLHILQKIKEINPKIEAVIVTAFASEQTKMQALQFGAFEYISKPFMMEVIYDLVDRALAKHKK